MVEEQLGKHKVNSIALISSPFQLLGLKELLTEHDEIKAQIYIIINTDKDSSLDQILNVPEGYSLVASVGLAGAVLSVFMWSLNPLSDFQSSTDRTRSLLPRVVDTTNFVTTWVICAFLVFEIFNYFS